MVKTSGGTRTTNARTKYLSNGLPVGTAFHKISVDGVRQGMIDLAGRKIVVVNINGVDVPFYLSTGKGGKYNVESGKWYPFFGIDPYGWFNKGSQTQINDYYGSPKLKLVAEALDKKWGDIRDDSKRKVVAKSYKENPEQLESVRRQINRDVKPMEEFHRNGERNNYSEIRVFSGYEGDKMFEERIEKINKKIK